MKIKIFIYLIILFLKDIYNYKDVIDKYNIKKYDLDKYNRYV